MVKLILGIGNEFRCDDAVGVHFAKKLNDLNNSEIKVLSVSGEGAELMELWEGVDELIICDAVCSGSEPGTIHILEPHKNSIPSQFFNYSTHAFSLAEAIEMAKVLGKLPKKVIIYGIEGENFANGLEVTNKVQNSLEQVVQQVRGSYA